MILETPIPDQRLDFADTPEKGDNNNQSHLLGAKSSGNKAASELGESVVTLKKQVTGGDKNTGAVINE